MHLCILHLFVCIAFVLILLLCFSFVWVKIQNHVKSENFKKSDRICLSTYYMWVLPCTFIQMTLCIYELSLFFMHLYLCGKNLNIYVWFLQINLQACHELLVNSHVGFDTYVDLCLYIFPHFLSFLLKELTKCKSPNEKRYWVAKAVTHTSIWLGKRESDLYWKCMMPKSQRLVHQIEISKNFRHRSQNEMYWFKMIKCYGL